MHNILHNLSFLLSSQYLNIYIPIIGWHPNYSIYELGHTIFWNKIKKLEWQYVKSFIKKYIFNCHFS